MSTYPSGTRVSPLAVPQPAPESSAALHGATGPATRPLNGTVAAVFGREPAAGITGTRGSDVGALTHVAIRLTVPALLAGTVAEHGLLDHLYSLCEGFVAANPNKRQVLVTEAAGFAHRYLTTCVPSPPWTLMATEYNLDRGAKTSQATTASLRRDGRADLAWFNIDSGDVFFDEVKTTRLQVRSRGLQSVAAGVPTSWLDQAGRYAAAGSRLFGPRFLGVRLLPLRGMSDRWLVQAGDRTLVSRLALSPGQPTPVPHAYPTGRTRTEKGALAIEGRF